MVTFVPVLSVAFAKGSFDVAFFFQSLV